MKVNLTKDQCAIIQAGCACYINHLENKIKSVNPQDADPLYNYYKEEIKRTRELFNLAREIVS